MHYLILYRKQTATLESCTEVPQHALPATRAARNVLERVALLTGSDLEVVILEANSLDELKRNHGRYFKTLEELATEYTADLQW